MPPRLQLFRSRPLSVFQSSTTASCTHPVSLPLRLQKRFITADEKPLPKSDQPGPGPNQEQLPHVSEEAAATGQITGSGGPDIDQGTPVQEVLKRDEKSQENAPKILQEEIHSSSPKGSRAFSTSSRNRQEALNHHLSEAESPGHFFGLPQVPLPSDGHMKYRYDPLVKQVTNLMMQDGKKGVAQRNMAVILNYLRTTPAPHPRPDRPLLIDSSSVSRLPLDPIQYLSVAIDSVAPLLRLRNQKGGAGGGLGLQIPMPLGIRQRRRTAVQWILDAASKRRTKGSGRDGFAHKVAEELVSIVEGRSGLWDRRGMIHKQGVSARANLSSARRRR